MSDTTIAGERPLLKFLRHWFAIEADELGGALAAFGCAFAMFSSYAILRPIRDTMGITSGWTSLPALFWSTFACMLAIQPVYGWLVSRYRRSVALPWVYAFFATNILGFYVWFTLQQDHTWIARIYFVWTSVFNLFVVAVFWSLMADVFRREQAARLFGLIAAGISLGGLTGPLLAGWLAKPLGTINLLLISAGLLLTSAALMRKVVRWHAERPESVAAAGHTDTGAALKGSAWAAFAQVSKSPYLICIAIFVLLLSAVNTVLYLEQQRLVAIAITDSDARTAFFARIDAWVQFAALLGQLLLFSRMQRWFGFALTLTVVPVLMLLAFGVMAFEPTLYAVVGATIVRRVGEFALVRPSRDMLYTVVSREEKYKAKSLIDTFVYRGGDAISASVFAAITVAGAAIPGIAGMAGMVVAAAWWGLAVWLGRRFAQIRS